MGNLHTVVQGEGETVLCLHSGGFSSRQWRKLADRLAPGYRVVMPDFAGHGSNPPWPHGQPLEFEQDLDAVSRLVPGPFHVVGHSYGGFLALLLARGRAEDVLSVAVYDPVSFGVLRVAADVEGLADLERVAQDPVFHDAALGGGEAWFHAFIDYWNGPGGWQALPPATKDNFLRVGRLVYLGVMSLMAEGSGAETYRVIDSPTLLMYGESTPVAARRVVQLLGPAMPCATVECIAGAGHMGPITHADVVNERIMQHITQAARFYKQCL